MNDRVRACVADQLGCDEADVLGAADLGGGSWRVTLAWGKVMEVQVPEEAARGSAEPLVVVAPETGTQSVYIDFDSESVVDFGEPEPAEDSPAEDDSSSKLDHEDDADAEDSEDSEDDEDGDGE